MRSITAILSTVICLIGLIVSGCSSGSGSSNSAVQDAGTGDDTLISAALSNQAPYLPPQCYTKTVDKNNAVHNTCFTCHTKGMRPDFINDNNLQLEFAFPQYAEQNHWSNFFKDRSSAITDISVAEIEAYIRSSNYFDAHGDIKPSATLADLPANWDYDGDGLWSGYVPDCYFSFDESGFDKDPSGQYTGWRALAYYPFPATHWPANGDYADVLIRLPEVFQTFGQAFDLETYTLNLAILEALIKRSDVEIAPIDESRYDVDLDKDGTIGTADRIVYDWAPNDNKYMHYVGDARTELELGNVNLAAGLFPKGTEFLNTLRYIDATDEGTIRMAPRMKEIRYARKIKYLNYSELETIAIDEIKERDDFPDRLKLPMGNLEDGVTNGVGWVFNGFIEDAAGSLRPQTFEETASCIGCHGGVGATTDSTFAFARKLDAKAFQKGWYHWTQKDMQGLNEPKAEYKPAGVQYEYSYYLMYAGAGDEYRNNREIQAAFFDDQGVLKQDMAEQLHEDISTLLYPSRERAMDLNRVYKQIVEEQSFTAGRTPILSKAEEVFETMTPADLETKVEQPLILTEMPQDKGCAPCVDIPSEPASSELQTAINGNGMSGPDGQRYQIDQEGLIDESTYAVTTQGVYFPFPKRHTLPARMIVPLGSIPVCYECHRLDSSVPPENTRVTVPVNFTAASTTESDLTLVQLTQDNGRDVNGVWSPDGTQIAWETDRSGSFQIWIMNSDGSQKRALTQGPAIHGWPQWSPDGTKLVYWAYDESSEQYSILTSAADGSDVTVIAASSGILDRPAWSPDGTAIAWGAQTDGNWDIWVADSAGSQSYRLTYDAQMESNPLWRPDGAYIAYKVAPNKAYNLTVENFLNVQDGFESPTVRTWDGIKSIQMNDWSPDGNKITYTAEIVTNASGEDRVSYLAVVEDVSFSGSRTSGTPVILSAHNTLGDRGPTFSPDGSQVAFWSWDKSFRATLWVAAADGSSLKQLTREGPDMGPKWHPGGDRLLFESYRAGNLDIWTVVVEE
jgi:Tol biopolymer transport system component